MSYWVYATSQQIAWHRGCLADSFPNQTGRSFIGQDVLDSVVSIVENGFATFDTGPKIPDQPLQIGAESPEEPENRFGDKKLDCIFRD